MLVLQRIQPWQLPCRVPPQRSLIAVPIIDIHLDVVRARAARRNEDAARRAAHVRRRSRERAIDEAYVEETAALSFVYGGNGVGGGRGEGEGGGETYNRATALRYGYAVASSGTDSITRDAYMSIARNEKRKPGFAAYMLSM